MPTPPPLPAQARLKKKPSRWRIPLIILGVLFGLLALFALLVAGYIWLAKDMPVTEGDRAVLVTATWAAKWIDDLEVDPKLETIGKVRHFDGSYELAYEYDGEYLYLACEVAVDTSIADAKITYFGLTKAQALIFSLEDLELRDNPRLLEWGDQSFCSLLYNEEGEIAGNYFACRVGKRTFSMTLAGSYFDDPAQLRDLLVPILRRLRTYKP